jgi:hypothetical protein
VGTGAVPDLLRTQGDHDILMHAGGTMRGAGRARLRGEAELVGGAPFDLAGAT